MLCTHKTFLTDRPASVQDGTYAPFLGQLAKLVFLASSMHQLTVSIFSTLPFVIGQVSTIPMTALLTAEAPFCKGCHDSEEAGLLMAVGPGMSTSLQL